MTDQARPRRSSITDRLDAMEFKLRADMANLELRVVDRLNVLETKLTARIEAVDSKLTSRIEAVDSKVSALSRDFLEFNGFAKGAAVVGMTLVPVATALAVTGLNYWLLRHGLPPR